MTAGPHACPGHRAMNPSRFFHHCPRCGTKQPAPPAGNMFVCAGCGFRYFFNAAAAAAAFIRRRDGRWLFIRRAKDPGKGMLAPAGRFIDIGEAAETAVRREIREEVGLRLEDVRFLCSHPNSYLYGDVTYPTLDLFFVAKALEGDEARALDDVQGFVWAAMGDIAPEQLAFMSMQAAWRQLRAEHPVGP